MMKKLLFIALLASGLHSYAKDLLNFPTVVDLADHTGTPFFEVMVNQIKPGLDAYATDGFLVADGKTIQSQLKNVSTKVANGSPGKVGLPNLLKLANKLNTANQKTTFYTLQANPALKKDKFGAPSFLALMSGGGVAVKINEDAYAYNVNYGTGEIDDDEMTGRSYGAAGTHHKASDASDKEYLKALEKIARPAKSDDGADIRAFTKGILDVVIRSDGSNFSKMSDNAQGVAADFVAVYTAEEDRHLMVKLGSHHWDSALLEVSLLANFHGGQKKLKIMYESSDGVYEFTDTVTNQQRVDDLKAPVKRKAGMLDYWQFSKNPENPGRSGINITRQAFTMLEKKITAYEKANNPEIVAAVEDLLKIKSKGSNVFKDVSNFLINYDTQKDVKKVSKELITTYAAFLEQVRIDADLITKDIASSMKQ